MENEKIVIENETNDHRYFTIIPNYILNHSTAYDRDLYAQMKRIAGDNGVCYMSQAKMAKQCGVSINRLKKSLKYLVENEWIKIAGEKIIETKGGNQKVLVYKMVDLWNKNNDFYNKGVSQDDIPLSKGVSPNDDKGYHQMTKGVSPNDDKEDIYNKNYINKIDITPAQEAFDFFTGNKQEKVVEYLIEKGIPEQIAMSELKRFISYWTELNSTGKKQRWQMEKTFEVRRRLATWFSNVKSFNKEPKGIRI